MAHLCFMENRGKTTFWAAVAYRLKANGHNISWIVQNSVYAPPKTAGACYVLPFPKSAQLSDAGIPAALITDRGRTYFGAGSMHYGHYQREIDKALDRINPDIVIGEPTLFHELLMISACKEHNIPYLHPTMNRYPSGRFSIFSADSQLPVAGSADIYKAEKITTMAKAISLGNALPSYMAIPSRKEIFWRKIQRAHGLFRTLIGRWKGERYNTPSLSTKLKLQRQLKVDLKRWISLASLPSIKDPVLLYPLQMQPEANIDVWGRPYSDQPALIMSILEALPENGQLAVKANPKSKYEVSRELLDMAENNNKIVLLPIDMPMQRAHDLTNGAVTVSGTVGFEAVFGHGRCLSLRHPILQDAFPQFHADTPLDAVRKLLENPDAGRGNPELGAKLLELFVEHSFAGTINEPLYDPACLSPKNIDMVAAAMEIALQKVLS